MPEHPGEASVAKSRLEPKQFVAAADADSPMPEELEPQQFVATVVTFGPKPTGPKLYIRGHGYSDS